MFSFRLKPSSNVDIEKSQLISLKNYLKKHNSIPNYCKTINLLTHCKWYNKKQQNITNLFINQCLHEHLCLEPLKVALDNTKVKLAKATDKRSRQHYQTKIRNARTVAGNWCANFLPDSLCEVNNVDMDSMFNWLINHLEK